MGNALTDRTLPKCNHQSDEPETDQKYYNIKRNEMQKMALGITQSLMQNGIIYYYGFPKNAKK